MLFPLKQRLSKNTVMPLIVDCPPQLLSVLGFSFVCHDKNVGWVEWRGVGDTPFSVMTPRATEVQTRTVFRQLDSTI